MAHRQQESEGPGARLQQMPSRQQEKRASEAPKDREARLQQMMASRQEERIHSGASEPHHRQSAHDIVDTNPQSILAQARPTIL